MGEGHVRRGRSLLASDSALPEMLAELERAGARVQSPAVDLKESRVEGGSGGVEKKSPRLWGFQVQAGVSRKQHTRQRGREISATRSVFAAEFLEVRFFSSMPRTDCA